MKYIIVSSDAVEIEYIKHFGPPQFHDAPVITGTVTRDDVRYKTVAGNLPLSLAYLAEEVWVIEYTHPPIERRVYNLRDMASCGARMEKYQTYKDYKDRGNCAICGAPYSEYCPYAAGFYCHQTSCEEGYNAAIKAEREKVAAWRVAADRERLSKSCRDGMED